MFQHDLCIYALQAVQDVSRLSRKQKMNEETTTN